MLNYFLSDALPNILKNAYFCVVETTLAVYCLLIDYCCDIPSPQKRI